MELHDDSSRLYLLVTFVMNFPFWIRVFVNFVWSTQRLSADLYPTWTTPSNCDVDVNSLRWTMTKIIALLLLNTIILHSTGQIVFPNQVKYSRTFLITQRQKLSVLSWDIFCCVSLFAESRRGPISRGLTVVIISQFLSAVSNSKSWCSRFAEHGRTILPRTLLSLSLHPDHCVSLVVHLVPQPSSTSHPNTLPGSHSHGLLVLRTVHGHHQQTCGTTGSAARCDTRWESETKIPPSAQWRMQGRPFVPRFVPKTCAFQCLRGKVGSSDC